MAEDFCIKKLNNNLYHVLSQEPHVDIEVKVEEIEDFETDLIILNHDDRYVEEKELYENHVIKEELVIGPEELIQDFTPVEYKKNTDCISNIHIKKQKSVKSLANIQSLHKPIANCQYQCSDCNKCFRSKRPLLRHINDDHSIKKCQFCNKLINKTSNRKRHEDYFCPKNKAVIKNNAVLKYGMYTHRFICDICKKSYSHKNTLKNHIKTHTDEPERYKCKICDKSYIKKHALVCHVRAQHLKVHTYSCKYCRCTFAWRASLTSHEQRYHKSRS